MNSSKNLLKYLKKSDLDFKSFQLISSGEFNPEDVDWNFKDTLHPEFVHELFSSIPLYQTDYSIVTINSLKILFGSVDFFAKKPFIWLVNFELLILPKPT